MDELAHVEMENQALQERIKDLLRTKNYWTRNLKASIGFSDCSPVCRQMKTKHSGKLEAQKQANYEISRTGYIT